PVGLARVARQCASTTIKTAGCRASSEVWFTLPSSTRGWRGYRRTGEVTHVIVKAGIITGDGGGESRDERADGTQICALWRDTLGGEGAAHVANPGGSVCRGVAGDRGATAARWGAAGKDGGGGAEPAPCRA